MLCKLTDGLLFMTFPPNCNFDIFDKGDVIRPLLRFYYRDLVLKNESWIIHDFNKPCDAKGKVE